LGLATHFTSAARFPELGSALAEGAPLDAVLARFSETPPQPSLTEHRAVIGRVFGLASVKDILAALAKEGAWGEETMKLIAAGSPTSVKLAFRAVKEGAALDFPSCLKMEYRVVRRILAGADYYEGVRARLIDKDGNPRWQPAHIHEVSDAAVAAYFAPLGKDELTL
jgi:enoyl-CoA hydratase